MCLVGNLGWREGVDRQAPLPGGVDPSVMARGSVACLSSAWVWPLPVPDPVFLGFTSRSVGLPSFACFLSLAGGGTPCYPLPVGFALSVHRPPGSGCGQTVVAVIQVSQRMTQ
jgi:hypothetical protein